jgi:hypothetical protein
MKRDLLTMLQRGDRRSLGRAEEVASLVAKDRRMFGALMKGLWSEDAVVRMRAADAVEKATRLKPEWLAAYKKELLGLLVETEQQEVRWHLAAMVPRLKLNERERRAAMDALEEYLGDRSSIVKTCALQGLVDLGGNDMRVVEILREATRSGTAAMKARARKLLEKMEKRK